MSDHLQLTIADLETKLVEQIDQVNKTKNLINQLSFYAGQPVPYPDTTDAVTVVSQKKARNDPASFGPDAFFGKPLATSVKMILDARKEKDLGPADVSEVYKTLKAGGFNFESKDEENSLRGLAVSISKNTTVFVRLPNGQVGLAAWYGKGYKRQRPAANKEAAGVAETSTENDDTSSDDPQEATNE